MFKILKVLNNNGILVIDLDSKQEYIFLGKGVGFGKKVNQNVNSIDNAKAYCFTEEQSRQNSIHTIKSISPVFIEIAASIIEEAEKKFGAVDNNILLALADHIAFAIKRMQEGIELKNPFAKEIKVLFEEEYSVAKMGREFIKEKIGVEINDDEVGYITLHVHTALTREHVVQSMDIARMIQEGIQKIEMELGTILDNETISYTRLLTHMKFMILRVINEEKLHLDMTSYVLDNFPSSFDLAKRICKEFENITKKPFPDIEISYFAIHIERVKSVDE
ncbi:PRD domain-containing protein [Clostridium sp. MD294]|uniref:PRD domain-containing protein n=1 Tax=Clostridium sp. MD294 TaxID=97138 RepID=UPI0002C8ABD0|nr:PRD domain-containing protein [Clostridium sp. MD294]NDO45611.1 PRD domain-containing protein [Clostridium sp. MD294]USF30735.1 Levansucrase and sucrase synthesis operon antiterminator [Clostridium sp. MD294]